MSKIRKKVNNVITNPKHQIFANEWLVDMNGTRAYKVAYPHIKKDTTAKAAASRLLTDVNVKAYIDERLEEIKNERTADAQEVMEFLTSVMRGEIKEPVTVLDGDGYQKVVDLQPSVQTRRAAAVDIGKRYALFTDKVDLQQGDIVIKVGEWDAEDEED
ncbi:MAG: terminase small subunit [Vagococcus sp.]|nr:terminase small subunit [Vagococcus sp.]